MALLYVGAHYNKRDDGWTSFCADMCSLEYRGRDTAVDDGPLGRFVTGGKKRVERRQTGLFSGELGKDAKWSFKN